MNPCSRCNGQMFRDFPGEEPYCLQCGYRKHEVVIPPLVPDHMISRSGKRGPDKKPRKVILRY